MDSVLLNPCIDMTHNRDAFSQHENLQDLHAEEKCLIYSKQPAKLFLISSFFLWQVRQI